MINLDTHILAYVLSDEVKIRVKRLLEGTFMVSVRNRAVGTGKSGTAGPYRN